MSKSLISEIFQEDGTKFPSSLEELYKASKGEKPKKDRYFRLNGKAFLLEKTPAVKVDKETYPLTFREVGKFHGYEAVGKLLFVYGSDGYALYKVNLDSINPEFIACAGFGFPTDYGAYLDGTFYFQSGEELLSIEHPYSVKDLLVNLRVRDKSNLLLKKGIQPSSESLLNPFVSDFGSISLFTREATSDITGRYLLFEYTDHTNYGKTVFIFMDLDTGYTEPLVADTSEIRSYILAVYPDHLEIFFQSLYEAEFYVQKHFRTGEPLSPEKLLKPERSKINSMIKILPGCQLKVQPRNIDMYPLSVFEGKARTELVSQMLPSDTVFKINPNSNRLKLTAETTKGDKIDLRDLVRRKLYKLSSSEVAADCLNSLASETDRSLRSRKLRRARI